MKIQFYLFIAIAILLQGCQAQDEPAVLEYKVRTPKVHSKNPPLLLLLHGFGSNEDDLFQLTNYLDDDFLIVSARAPYDRSPGTYKWYHLDLSSQPYKADLEQAEQSRLLLLKFINQLKRKHDFDENKIVIGGFSQGGIMSYSVGLTEPDEIAGIISLSGRMLDDTKTNAKKDKLKSKKALIIHGTKDSVLSVDLARSAKTFLETTPMEITYHEIEMEHTINQEAIQYMNAWLEQF